MVLLPIITSEHVEFLLEESGSVILDARSANNYL